MPSCKAGQTTAEVTAQDVTPLVTVDSPTLGHVLERQRIEQLPINGRSISSLLQTVPGMESWRALGTDLPARGQVAFHGEPLRRVRLPGVYW